MDCAKEPVLSTNLVNFKQVEKAFTDDDKNTLLVLIGDIRSLRKPTWREIMSMEVAEQTCYSQDEFLANLLNTKEPVNIFLVNGIRLHGTVGGYDQHTVLLESVAPQIVYKHAISTIMVSKS